MRKFNFSDRVLKILHDSGWSENRHQINKIEFAPNMFPENIEDIIRSFDGLTIDISSPNLLDKYQFDFKSILLEVPTFEYWKELLGYQLYPLGESLRNSFFIGIDDDERIYLLQDQLFKFGESFEKSLDNLLFDYRYFEFDPSLDDWVDVRL